MRITIRFKEGESKVFENERRPGGSYTNEIRSEPGFAVVTDVWGKSYYYPTDTILEITTEPTR